MLLKQIAKIKWIAWILIYGQILLLSAHLTGFPSNAQASSLTIGDGVTVEAGTEGEIVVLDSLNSGKGRLTSGSASPTAGDWKGIKVEGSATGTQFNGTVIEYSGASGSPALDIRKSSPTVNGVEIKSNSGSGIRLTGGASSAIRDSLITGNAIGVEIGAGSNPSVQNSVIFGNTTAIQNLDTIRAITATNNWWGHPTGPKDTSDDRATGGLYNPTGLGSQVTDGVNYSPWSSVIPILGASFNIAEGLVTESQSLHINLSCKTCTEFRVSESSAFTGTTFQPFVMAAPFTLSSGDALKTVYVQFRTSTGNTSSTTSAQVRLDTAGPALTINSPLPGTMIGRPLSIDVSATDPSGVGKVEFYIDGSLAYTGTTNNYSYRWDVTAVQDGSHEIRVIAYDNIGHTTVDTRPVTVVKAPPASPEITSPLNGTALSTPGINVTGKAETGISVSLFLNDSFYGQTTANQAGDFQFSFVSLFEGSNTLLATASDKAGTSPPSPRVVLTIDTGPPPSPNIYSIVSLPAGKIKLEWTEGSGEVPVGYRLYRANAAFSTANQAALVYEGIKTSFEDTPPLDGPYYFGATSLDAAGNESPLSTVVSEVSDREGPSAIVRFSPAQFSVGPGDVSISLSLSGPVIGIPYLGITPSGGDATPVDLTKATETEWTGLYKITASTPNGVASLSFSAKDTIGNRGTQILEGSSLTIDTRGPIGSIQKTPSINLYKPGTVYLALTLDEPAVQVPILTFNPPSGIPVNVGLTGTGTEWSGSIEITPSMGEGTGYFVMEAKDIFGNTGTSLISGESMVLDVTPPLPPSSLTAISKPGGRVALSWDPQQDAATYRLYRVSSEGVIQLPMAPVVDSIAGVSYTDIPPSDGNYRYAVTAVDSAGNESALSLDVVALSDRFAPGPPQNLSLLLDNENVLISWDAPSGEQGLTYNLYRAGTPIINVSSLTPVQSGLSQLNTTDRPPADAQYYYGVTALDAAGNRSLPSNSTNIVYDMAPPIVGITGVRDGQFLSSSVTPGITVQDASIASVVMLLDGAAYTEGTAISAEGPHLLRIEARDTSQRTTVREVNFTIDLTDPELNISGVIENGNYDTAVAPVIEASDVNLDRVDITLNGRPYQSGALIDADGTHALRATAIDRAGRTKTVMVTFSIDAAPPKPSNLSIVADDKGTATLSWDPPGASDIAGYNVYKNGQRLTGAAISDTTYTDSTYSNSAVQVYGVSAVDTAGHEGALLQASVIPLDVTLGRYGTSYGNDFIMSKHYIEDIKVDIVNRHSAGGNMGPIALELRDNAGRIAEVIQGGTLYLAAGASISIEKVVPVGEGIVDYRTLNVSVQLPSEPDTKVQFVSTFNLNAFDPGRKIEIFNDPLIKGGMARVRLKIYNHGSAPIEVLTSSGSNPSPDVYVLLKDQDGNVLAKGNMNQRGGGVLNYSGYSLAEIPPGGSFLSEPVEFVVPLSATDKVYIEAHVQKIYYHYNKPDQVVGGGLSGFITASISQAPYHATVSPERATYDQNSPVLLSGEALDTVTNQPLPNASVKIGISVKGFDRFLFATTDETGRFSATFNPLPGEAGIYSLWATHPDVYDRPVQSGFSILGLSFDPRSINLRMSKNSSFSFPVSIKNVGESDLTSLQFSVAGGSGITGSVDIPNIGVLQGGEKLGLRVTLNTAIDAPDATSATVVVTTAEGITRSLDINIALLAAVPAIDTDPDYIEAGVNTNDIKVVTFKLKNIGHATLEDIQIEPPSTPWMGITTGVTLPPLEPESSIDIGVSFRPPANVSQGLHTDKIVIKSGNHVPYTLNVFAVVTSSDKGGAHIRAVDALAKFVNGARVMIGHQQVATLILTGTTDDNGELSFNDIPVGPYNYKVEAPGHEVVIGTFEILPDAITPVDVFMNNVFVTLEWSVTPMTLFDKFDITLVATFETQVPAPVITVEPAHEKLEIEIGSTYIGEFRVTNHGLVALENVEITPNFGPGLKVDVLITDLSRIGAKETVIIPYRLTVNRFKSPEPVDPCSTIPMEIAVRGEWVCTWDGRWVPTGGRITRTIVPKETYDLLGVCDQQCDWCSCLFSSTAGALCKCLRNGDLCKCAKALGGANAEGICGCAALVTSSGGTEDNLLKCLAAAGSAVGIEWVRNAVKLLDTFKNGVKCGMCLNDLIPGIEASYTPSGGGGGGGFLPPSGGLSTGGSCIPGTYP